MSFDHGITTKISPILCDIHSAVPGYSLLSKDLLIHRVNNVLLRMFSVSLHFS